MKKLISGGLFVLTMALLAACSKYTYYAVGSSNANLGRFRTFAWLPPMNNTRNPNYNNDIADEKIKDQATADLENKGLILKANNPDLLIRYSIMVDNKVRTYDEPMYNYNWGGYYPRAYYRGGRGFYYSYGGGPYPVYVGNEIERVPYKEGTLIIDVINRATGKVIWRGYGVGEVSDPQSAINDLPKIVDGIINKLPLSKMQ